jgi:hypothetical protein
MLNFRRITMTELILLLGVLLAVGLLFVFREHVWPALSEKVMFRWY